MELSRQLKKLLDPSRDRLLAGYSELISQSKAWTVAAIEDRKLEEQAYYEAKISRFSKDRRAAIKKDSQIRGFLEEKQAEMLKIL